MPESSSSPPSLFPGVEPEPPPAAPAPTESGPVAVVALENGLDRTLDYRIPKPMLSDLRVGQRVRVPLGKNNRPAFAFVLAINPESDHPRLKPLLSIADARVLVTPGLMALARWISGYYVCPLGTVLESVIPAAVKKRVGVGYVRRVRALLDRQQLQEILEKTKPPKRRAVLARLIGLEPGQSLELLQLARDCGVGPATLRKLAKAGWISIWQEPDLAPVWAHSDEGGDEPPLPLNEDQQRCYDLLSPRLQGSFSVNLLLGVTGSGKTEVYLRCLTDVLATGRQAIVMVPEIALTPQTVRRFTRRFKRVAVLHSGLSPTRRHRFWQQVLAGGADVVVGARSAVFAPMPNLGLIIVDEEHEPSYKQDTAPRYHGRDIAIKRGQLENVPVILGSATPSLETYYRARATELKSPAPPLSTLALSPATTAPAPTASPPAPPLDLAASSVATLASSTDPSQRPQWPHLLLRLPRRVRGLQMPTVELVDMKTVLRLRRGWHLLSPRLEHLLHEILQRGEQAILLLNRRGYSNFVHCASCGHVVQCQYCDTTMTYHRHSGADAVAGHDTLPPGELPEPAAKIGQLHCHYCLAINALPVMCPSCGKKLALFGLGTQRVEEELARKFPGLNFARVDSDSMRRAGDYEKLLDRFASGEVRVLLGTQMIAKGLDYPNVSLVGVISGDTSLALPDFRAAERTFQLITQVAGRAGRGEVPGRVVLQTFMPDDATIRMALAQDYEKFAQSELVHRKQVGLPPYARLVRLILRDQDPTRLAELSDEVAAAVGQATTEHGDSVRVRGPMPCAIARIAGYYRNQLVLSSTQPRRLQHILRQLRKNGVLKQAERIAVDVDPTSLL